MVWKQGVRWGILVCLGVLIGNGSKLQMGTSPRPNQDHLTTSDERTGPSTHPPSSLVFLVFGSFLTVHLKISVSLCSNFDRSWHSRRL
ncbi:hypothetical protein DEU56DRAFT_836504 [Suillus clintonianus]|uniref:uncharacterized protein n=1 Tax=Suillus clintonianus TaxID=1904413 RepID=UPI001B887371|nr:uncharacterized protein DEU56DRAFT_836504 [Suillus clintonianus]KAG2119361.1 hypothetical protein DEU56DRAFT_836504 [Suillus clintonianus]